MQKQQITTQTLAIHRAFTFNQQSYLMKSILAGRRPEKTKTKKHEFV